MTEEEKILRDALSHPDGCRAIFLLLLRVGKKTKGFHVLPDFEELAAKNALELK